MTILEQTAVTPRHRRGRAERPERLVVNGETLVRNDVKASEIGATERTINRGDARGAPYVFVAGVKYRPETRYNEFLLSHITQARRFPRDRRRRTPTI
jgi:hypothetical protein